MGMLMRDRGLNLLDKLIAPARHWLQQEIAPRFGQLELREQRLVLAAAVLLPLMMVVFLVVLPMQDRRALLQQHMLAMQQQAMQAEALAEQLLASGGAKTEQPVSLLAHVERIARQTGVRRYMTRIRPQQTPGSKGERLMLQLKNVPYQDVLRFTDSLVRSKLNVISMKIQTGNSAGMTHVQAVIAAG